jgi:hypothetical protein
MRFREKVAIVTGGGSGMGKEVATRLPSPMPATSSFRRPEKPS